MAFSTGKEAGIGDDHPPGNRAAERIPNQGPGHHHQTLMIKAGCPLDQGLFGIGSSMHASLCAMVNHQLNS